MFLCQWHYSTISYSTIGREMLEKINTTSETPKNQFELWSKYATNLLTSTLIANFSDDAFQKRKVRVDTKFVFCGGKDYKEKC